MSNYDCQKGIQEIESKLSELETNYKKTQQAIKNLSHQSISDYQYIQNYENEDEDPGSQQTKIISPAEFKKQYTEFSNSLRNSSLGHDSLWSNQFEKVTKRINEIVTQNFKRLCFDGNYHFSLFCLLKALKNKPIPTMQKVNDLYAWHRLYPGKDNNFSIKWNNIIKEEDVLWPALCTSNNKVIVQAVKTKQSPSTQTTTSSSVKAPSDQSTKGNAAPAQSTTTNTPLVQSTSHGQSNPVFIDNVYSGSDKQNYNNLVTNKDKLLVYSRNMQSQSGAGSAGIGDKTNAYGITLGEKSGKNNGFTSLTKKIVVHKTAYNRVLWDNKTKYDLLTGVEDTKNQTKETTVVQLIFDEFKILQDLIARKGFKSVYFPCQNRNQYDKQHGLDWGADIYLKFNGNEDFTTYKTNFEKILKYVTRKKNRLKSGNKHSLYFVYFDLSKPEKPNYFLPRDVQVKALDHVNGNIQSLFKDKSEVEITIGKNEKIEYTVQKCCSKNQIFKLTSIHKNVTYCIREDLLPKYFMCRGNHGWKPKAKNLYISNQEFEIDEAWTDAERCTLKEKIKNTKNIYEKINKNYNLKWVTNMKKNMDNVRILVSDKVVEAIKQYVIKRAKTSQFFKTNFKDIKTNNKVLRKYLRRLVCKRPFTFFYEQDTTLFRDGILVPSATGVFSNLNQMDETDNRSIKDYLCYDEIALACYVSVGGPVQFLNKGDRGNRQIIKNEYIRDQKTGVQYHYIGCVGARFEKNKTIRRMLPKYIPKEEENNLRKLKHFQHILNTGNESDKVTICKIRLKERLRHSIYPFMHYAAQQANCKVFIVGLGAGVWAGGASEFGIENKDIYQIIIDIVADFMKDETFQTTNIREIVFSHFKGGSIENKFKTALNVCKKNSNPGDPPGSGIENVVAMYAWDGNSFPGNEFWVGHKSASGDPAAACASTIPVIHNPALNKKLYQTPDTEEEDKTIMCVQVKTKEFNA